MKSVRTMNVSCLVSLRFSNVLFQEEKRKAEIEQELKKETYAKEKNKVFYAYISYDCYSILYWFLVFSTVLWVGVQHCTVGGCSVLYCGCVFSTVL